VVVSNSRRGGSLAAIRAEATDTALDGQAAVLRAVGRNDHVPDRRVVVDVQSDA
jgi:hypothetical protein